MTTDITIGSCKSYEEFQGMMYNWRAVADRIYEVIQTLPDDDNKHIVSIIEWDFLQDEDKIRAKCLWQGTDSCMALNWAFPAKYLFMSDDEILADCRRIEEEKEAREHARQKQELAALEQKQYQTYLRLKEVYEGTEAVNGLPEKSPNL